MDEGMSHNDEEQLYGGPAKVEKTMRLSNLASSDLDVFKELNTPVDVIAFAGLMKEHQMDGGEKG
jgi:hypothetical protein